LRGIAIGLILYGDKGFGSQPIGFDLASIPIPFYDDANRMRIEVAGRRMILDRVGNFPILVKDLVALLQVFCQLACHATDYIRLHAPSR
jgi:hypothetical protein